MTEKAQSTQNLIRQDWIYLLRINENTTDASSISRSVKV